MSVALVTRTTSRVEHLGSWTADHDAPDAWTTGRWAPICGSEKHHGSWTPVGWLSGSADRVVGVAKRKRLCTRCRRNLDALVMLAADATAEPEPLPLEAPDDQPT